MSDRRAPESGSGGYDFAHWGETRETMRAVAIAMFRSLLSADRAGRSFPQDGSSGQAKAYHDALIASLEDLDR